MQIHPFHHTCELIDMHMPFHLLKLEVGGIAAVGTLYGPRMVNGILSDIAGIIEGVQEDLSWGQSKDGIFYIFFLNGTQAETWSFANHFHAVLLNSRFRVSLSERLQLFVRFGCSSYPTHGETWSALQNMAHRGEMAKHLLPLPNPKIIVDDE